MRILNLTMITGAVLTAICATGAQRVTSPNGKIGVEIDVDANGSPYYTVTYGDKTIVDHSYLGLTAKECDMTSGYSLTASAPMEFDETWEPVWGEYSTVRNHYNEMLAELRGKDETTPRFDVRVRVFDDGVGFRYELPEQPGMNYLTLMDEVTEFKLTDDYTMYCIPGDYDTDEFAYVTSPMSELASNLRMAKHTESNLIGGLAVQTPLMLKGKELPVYVNIHEAALVGYPAMALDVEPESKMLSAHLTPDKLGVRAYLQAPFNTPWRTLIISNDPCEILASQLIYNLNEPNKIEDTSWIKPRKFVGVWWEMFTGRKKTWAYSDKYNAKPGVTDYSQLPSNGRHPANTANVKRYIDFAAESGIPAVLVEGWNEGWEDWAGYVKNRQFLFDKPYPDFDIDYLTKYAADKGVKLIMHHETAANAADYERQLDRAFKYMNDHGYDAVKTGYVGHVIPRSEYHSSQWMVDHYLHVAQRAAEHKIMVDSHEAVRPTGLARTWPNWIAQESARGGEWESMGGNKPEHTTILPFTRLKGGPMDYTPGLFQTDLSYYNEGKTDKGGTTLARQLALYVTMASPLQMACDLPENYRRFADAFQFIKDVSVDWANSIYLEAEPGDYITVARLDKNSDDWYVGTVTDENARTAKIDLSFLPKGQKYVATIYADGKDADWHDNPQSYDISTRKVDSRTHLKIAVVPGGGAAIRLTPAK